MNKKLLSFLLSVIIVCSASVTHIWALNGNKSFGNPDGDEIVILCTNDVHCAIDQVTKTENDKTVITNLGYSAVAAYKKDMEKTYGTDNVTLVDAGDAIQGAAVGTLSDGKYLVDIMNTVGYDIAVPGNHEFDYGVDTFLQCVNEADYNYISSNFRFVEDNKNELIFDPYTIVEYGTEDNKIKVAYVGICTPETLTKSSPKNFMKGNEYIYSFDEDTTGQKLYTSVQTAVNDARDENKGDADYVVAIGHLGQNGITERWSAESVIKNTNGIDIMIDGHSHEKYCNNTIPNNADEAVPVMQNGYQLSSLGKITIDPNASITGENIICEQLEGTDVNGDDTFVSNKIQEIHEELDDMLSQKIGESKVTLYALDPADNYSWLVRSQETNLGDFCADAYRWALNADIGLNNGGGIRANIKAGDITYGDIIAVHPYNNQLSLVKAKGQNILDALEMAYRNYPEPSGSFLQVSGLTYEIDPSVPSSVTTNDNGAFTGVSGARRVKNVKVGGQTIEYDKTYTVASHDFLLKNGGDGMTMFQNCEFVEDEVMLDNQALIRYTKEVLNGNIGSQYEKMEGQGRIKIANSSSVQKALVPKTLKPNNVTPNPYLSPGDSVIHNDPYGSDVTDAVLPLGINSVMTKANDSENIASCPSSVLYDRYGNAITQLNGGLSIANLDKDGIPRSWKFVPPTILNADGKPAKEYTLQTSYSMVDNEDHIIAPTSHGHIYYLRTKDENGNLTAQEESLVLDLNIVKEAKKQLGDNIDPRLLSVIYDYKGNLWFASGGFLVIPENDSVKYPGGGFMGYLSHDYIKNALDGQTSEDISKYIHFQRFEPGEGAENGISSSENGVVILTNKRCYMFNADSDGGIKQEWEPYKYETSGWKHNAADYSGSGLAYGSGTTPTLTKDLILFTDNTTPVNLIALDADTGKEVVKTPIFEELTKKGVPVSVENSILVYSSDSNRACVVICNWYGAGNAKLGATGGDSSVQTWDNIYDAEWMQNGNSNIAPGITRVDIVKNSENSYSPETKWVRNDIHETAMVKLSTATGYLYGYWQVDKDGKTDNLWRYEILDFDTGETSYSYAVSDDPQYNNMAVGMIPSPKGNGLYCPSNTKGSEKYLTCLRDNFASFSNGETAEPSELGRELISDKEFQNASGTLLAPASYLMSANIKGINGGTKLTFKVNGLERPANEYKLYQKGSDGKFTLVDTEKWTLETDSAGNLTPSVLYPLTIELDGDKEEVSVILAAKSAKPDTPVKPSEPSSSGSSASGGGSPKKLSKVTENASDKLRDEVTANTSGITVKPSVTGSDENGEVSASVTSEMGKAIVQQALDSKSSHVVIAPEFDKDVTKTKVIISSAAVNEIGNKTSANLAVCTPVAEVTFANSDLCGLAENGGDIIVAAEKTNSIIELAITAGGEKITSVSDGITIKVPVKASTSFGTVAMLIKPDGTKEVIRKSIVSDRMLSVPLKGSAKISINDNSKIFEDVPKTSWAYDAISFASGHELFNGISEILFAPNDTMTRSMLAMVLHNLESNPKAKSKSSFTDINTDTWYTDAVYWAAENGYVNGYPDGSFRPNDPITREQITTILYRYAKGTGHNVSVGEDTNILSFNDTVNISDYAVPAIQWACGDGILNGKPGRIIDPKGNATRAEIAVIIMRFMQ